MFVTISIRTTLSKLHRKKTKLSRVGQIQSNEETREEATHPTIYYLELSWEPVGVETPDFDPLDDDDEEDDTSSEAEDDLLSLAALVEVTEAVDRLLVLVAEPDDPPSVDPLPSWSEIEVGVAVEDPFLELEVEVALSDDDVLVCWPWP